MKRPILTHAMLAPIAHAIARFGRTGALSASAALFLFGGVAAFGTAPSTVLYEGRFDNVVEQIPLPDLPLTEPTRALQVRETRIQQGDTLQTLMSRLGVSDAAAFAFLRGSPATAAIFRQMSPGKTLTAEVAPDGSLHALAFPLNGSKDAVLQVQKTAEGFQAEKREAVLETRLSLQSAVIRHSLFGAADDAGIPEAVAAQLADIFGGDIDFHRDLRKGDRFSVVYETATHLGKAVRAQKILAAEFVNDGKAYQAFWYRDKEGNGGYYGADGRSLKKAFLRSPLEFSRVTSGFSNARYHPVLRETRAHLGIDYGAPVGTRVRATGDGVVEFVGNQGGYGKVVRIRHAGDKTTVYGHLSGFASGLRNGGRVSQGELIGYVGATGLATGPHLHYEFRVAGVHRNPLTVALPAAQPLQPSQLSVFREHVADMTMQIAAVRGLQLVRLD